MPKNDRFSFSSLLSYAGFDACLGSVDAGVLRNAHRFRHIPCLTQGCYPGYEGEWDVRKQVGLLSVSIMSSNRFMFHERYTSCITTASTEDFL